MATNLDVLVTALEQQPTTIRRGWGADDYTVFGLPCRLTDLLRAGQRRPAELPVRRKRANLAEERRRHRDCDENDPATSLHKTSTTMSMMGILSFRVPRSSFPVLVPGTRNGERGTGNENP